MRSLGVGVEDRERPPLLGAACLLLALVLLVALVLMAFFAEGMDYACSKTFLVPNVALIPLCVAAFVGLAWLLSGRARLRIRHVLSSRVHRTDLAILLATIVLFVVQVGACREYAFRTGWDSGTVTDAAWLLARGEELEGWYPVYFSRCPNNLFLLWVAEQCMRLALALGAESTLGGVLVFSVLNCAAVGLASWLTYRCVSVVSTRAWGLFAWALCVLLIWTSPWAGILYSDCAVVFVPAAVLLCFARLRMSSGLRRAGWWALMGFVAVVGYKIKPQVVFPLAAIVAVCVGGALRKAWRARGERGCLDYNGSGRAAVALTLGCAIAFGMASAATGSMGVSLDEDAQFGPTHYLMMGLNEEARGIYLESDVGYSQSFPDQESRARGNLAVIGERLRGYGPVGLASLMADKLMTNFADGTFAWGMEGNFFNESTTANAGGALTRAVRSLYYPDGSCLDLFKVYAHSIWLFVLVGCVFSCVLCVARGEGEMWGILGAIVLSLLMLIGFELLFEARARYLFSSLTVFIILATLGMRRLCLTFGERRSEQRGGEGSARHLAAEKRKESRPSPARRSVYHGPTANSTSRRESQ